jgi:hypothetical protein
MTVKSTHETKSLKGLKFTFQKGKGDKFPSNCPIGTGEDNTVDKYDVLGFFPTYKIFAWAFRDDPNFNWKGYWEDQCGMKRNPINTSELVKKLDKMQEKNIGDLTTGATTFLGLIGQKAIRDGDMKTAGKIWDSLFKYNKFIDKEFKDSGKCTTEDAKDNCDDSRSRIYLGIGRMTTAAIDSGLVSPVDEDEPDQKLVLSTKRNKKSGLRLPRVPSGKEFIENPYKHGFESLLKCMIKSENDSLKRDICTEMVKDVMVAGAKNKKYEVMKSALDHLNLYYEFDDKKNELVDKTVETWVNTTVWKGDALIDLLDHENKTGEKLIILDKKGNKYEAAKLLLEEGIKSQLKEYAEEFSTADWITQQALIINAAKGIYDRHDEIIETIPGGIGADKKIPRIAIWNNWVVPYLDSMKDCSETSDAQCTIKRDNALLSLAAESGISCLTSATLDKDLKGGLDEDAKKTCSDAIAKILEKTDDIDVINVVLESYFQFAQGENKGLSYIPYLKEKLEGPKGKEEEGMFSKKFTPDYLRKTFKSEKIIPVGSKTETIDGVLWTTQDFTMPLLKERPYKINQKTFDVDETRSYGFRTIRKGDKMTTKIVEIK